MEKTFLQVSKRQKTDHIPVWFMRQAGRYLPEYMAIRKTTPNFLTFCYTPEKAAEVTLQPVHRFDMDAAILFSDILVIPDALRQKVEFIPGKGPVLEAIEDPKDVDTLLNVDEAQIHKHLEPVYETVSRVSSDLSSSSKILIGFAGAPWTVLCYMLEGQGSRDYIKAKGFALKYPEAFEKLLRCVENATIAYLKAQIDHGAQAIQIFDSWAGVLDPLCLDTYVHQSASRIFKAIKSYKADIPVIGFAKGIGMNLVDYARIANPDIVGLDTNVHRRWAKDHLGKDFVLQGNLDPVILRQGGDILAQHIDQIINDFGETPFIFNLGHGIIKDTNPDHVAFAVQRIKAQQ